MRNTHTHAQKSYCQIKKTLVFTIARSQYFLYLNQNQCPT